MISYQNLMSLCKTGVDTMSVRDDFNNTILSVEDQYSIGQDNAIVEEIKMYRDAKQPYVINYYVVMSVHGDDYGLAMHYINGEYSRVHIV
jgi:hypothetical protein